MNEDRVADEEILYRCVFYKTPDGKKLYHQQDGRIFVSSQVFRDRNCKPSVDRAILCNSDPMFTQKSENDGVISLVCEDIRQIKSVTQCNKKGKVEFTYEIDVIARTETDEGHKPAHAQIEPSPEYQSKAGFRKLLERLAFLANQREWEILPIDLRAMR